MSKSMVNFTKGIITGVVVGTTVGMVMRGMSKPAKKRNTGNMVKHIGTVMSHFNDMMR